MKSKRIMPLLLSAIMTVGTATAVPFTASAVETNAPVVSAQSAKTSLATPKISKAESINGGVKISWGKVNGAEKYRIYYKGSKGWTRMVDTTSTSYIDKDVSSGKNYTYTVRCINSSATKFTSGYDSKGKSVKYISAPKITKAESVDGGVKISWNKVNGAEKYRVYYKGSKGWTRMVDTTSTSYIDKDVSSGKTYTYTVRCINASATKFTSGYDSKGVTVTTPVKPSVKPTKTTIKLDKTKVTLGAGEPCTLKATVSPSQKVTWTSSNPKIVKVDANGKLTVTKALYDIEDYWADVKITAKANGVSATCIVSADGYRTYHKYAIVPVYKPTDLDVCKGCGRLIKYNAAPGTKYETEDGRKGVFITKEDHTAHWKAHMNEGVPSGWYSEVVMLKVGERVQREGWYVD